MSMPSKSVYSAFILLVFANIGILSASRQHNLSRGNQTDPNNVTVRKTMFVIYNFSINLAEHMNRMIINCKIFFPLSSKVRNQIGRYLRISLENHEQEVSQKSVLLGLESWQLYRHSSVKRDNPFTFGHNGIEAFLAQG